MMLVASSLNWVACSEVRIPLLWSLFTALMNELSLPHALMSLVRFLSLSILTTYSRGQEGLFEQCRKEVGF